MNSEDKQVSLIVIGASSIIIFFSALLGYYINVVAGILAGSLGFAMVILPALLFLREVNKPDNISDKESREAK